MAVGTPVSELSSRRPSDSDGLGKVVEYDRYIEAQLRRTRRQVKNVDIASSLMLLAVGSLAYLMAVALVDHWLVAGGLSFAGRVAAFSLLAAGVLAYVVLRLVPLVLRRINPVYAAYTIERHRPGIKNGLINFLLLRKGSDRLPDRIYEAMEVQAVNALTGTQTDVAVDRTPVIRLLLAMVAILMCVAFYTVFSPKNPFTSFRRVISPWANVAPPTRVSIDDILPGDGSGFHDQHVKVSALVGGLRTGEEATVHYSTRDGQVVDRPVPMTLAESGYRHFVELPPDNFGLQQDLEYWIIAGDAISPHYQIKVDTAPTIVLEEIEYQYPKYSELPPRKVARHGDIQALDGTRVTLRAKANQPIAQANLDFECDGRNDLEMRVDGRRADVSFVLAMNEKTRRGEHESYQLRFRNEDGHENPKPIRYSIEVIPDLPPEVELVEPELDPSKDLVVPPSKPVRFGVQAADPDFKLAGVKFHVRRRGSTVVDESLLAEPRGGEFHRDYMLDLKRLALKPGEQVEFWAAADDNRQPKANHTETTHYHLRIATPDEKGQQGDQNADKPDDKQGQKDGNAEQKQPRGERNENGQQGNQGEAGQQPSKEKQGGGSNQGDKQDQKQQQQGESGGENDSQGGKSSQQPTGKGSQAGGSNKNSSDKPSGEGNSESAESGQGKKKDGQQGTGDKSDPSKRIDPERDPGKAIEEINKYFDQKNKQSEQPKDDQQQSGGQQSDKNSGNKGQQEEAGSKEKQGQQSQGGEAGEQQQKGDATSGKQSSNERGTSGGRDAEAGGTEKQTAGKQSSEKKENDKQGAKESQQQPAGGEKSGREGAANKQQAGKKQGDDKQGEQGPLGEKKKNEQEGQGERNSNATQADESHGDEPAGDKQAGKAGQQASSGEKAAKGSEKGTPNQGGDKTQKDESGNGKEGDAKVGDEGAKRADQETKPREGQGGQARGAGETDDKMKKHEGESPDQKGGDQDSDDKGDAGAGNSDGGNKHGAPTMKSPNKGREKKQISPDNKKPTSDDNPEMASEDKKQSDSQGGEEGDRNGGGKSGGGQRSNSEGTGSAGQNSEADQGGQQGETQGKGATGSKGGDQQKSDKPTGGKPSGEKGAGSNQGGGKESDRGIKADSPETADPRGHTNESRQPTQTKDGQPQPPNEKQPSRTTKQKKTTDGAPQADSQQEGAQGEPKPSDRGGNDIRGGRQRSNPTQGGQPGDDDEEATPPPSLSADDSEPGGEDPNLEYARKATDLALERLKDQLAKGQPDPELLKKLNWSREDMERFRQQWERLKKSADEAGSKGQAARQEFDDALRSLGLRPRGASLSGGQKGDDRDHNLREDRRAAPPAEYLEQWREFRKSTAKSPKR